MVGLLLWKEERAGKRAVMLEERRVLQLRVCCGEILRTERTPEAVLCRRTAAALKRMKRKGVNRLILPEDFPCAALLERMDLQPVSTAALRQALAVDWVRWDLTRRGKEGPSTRVAVAADRLTGEVARAITELALQYRYVLLDLPYGGEELSRRLRREYGVSLLVNPSVEQLGEAEVLVLFAPRPECRAARALRIYDEGVPLPPLSIPPALEEQIPKGVRREQMLSFLREAGLLQPGQITVGRSNSAKKGGFLADWPS